MKKAFCSVIFSMTCLYETVLTSDLNFPSYLSGQKGTSGNISQPRLFISRPRPAASASKMQPRLWKLSIGSLLSTSVTWEKLKSEVKTIFLQTCHRKKQNKILLIKSLRLGNNSTNNSTNLFYWQMCGQTYCCMQVGKQRWHCHPLPTW